MPKRNEAWGIEVGAFALKAVKLSRHGGEVQVDDYTVQRFKQVLTTPDVDVDEQVRLALDTFMQNHDLAKSNVVVSVPGNLAFARFAKLPPVEAKRIAEIVRYEAVQQIPFPLEQVEWDYQVFRQDDAPDVEVGIFAITKERVLNYLANFNAQDLPVDSLTLSPLAVYNAFAYETAGEDGPADDEGVMLMDIGTSSTDIIIVEGGNIWLRTFSLGGNHFTEALVKQFKISFPKAEKLKREAATSKYAKQIFQAMKGVYGDLVQEVQRSLGYYQSINAESNVTRIIGLGSTMRLPGLAKFLKSNLQIEVDRPDGYERIAVDGKREADFANHAVNLATAYGLALQGLGIERVSANLLPSHVLAARNWRAKQPYLLASAACCAIAAGLVGYSYYATFSAHDEKQQAVAPAVRSTLAMARNQQSQLNQVVAEDPRPRIDNIRRTLDYRELWPGLMTDLGEALAGVDPPPSARLPDGSLAQAEPVRGARKVLYLDQLRVDYTPRQPKGNEAIPTEPLELFLKFKSTDFFGEGSGGPPRFRVTIEGTTPYAKATELIEGQFFTRLKEVSEANDRPYRIKVAKQPFVEIASVVETSTTNTGTPPRRSSGAGLFGSPSAAPSPLPQAPDETLEAFALPEVVIDEFLPLPPLASESVSKDTRFIVEFTVELLPPEEVRKSRIADAPPPADPPATDPVVDSAQGESSASAGTDTGASS